MKKTISVKLDDKTVEISKLPLGKYAELLTKIKELPKHLESIQGLSNDKILEQLPFLISVALPDVIAILTVATPLKAEEIEEMGLDEVTNVVLAIVEVNNFKGVYDNVKKAMAPKAQ